MASNNPYDDEWAPTYGDTLYGSQAGSQTGGSGAGLPGFDGLQAPVEAPAAGGRNDWEYLPTGVRNPTYGMPEYTGNQPRYNVDEFDPAFQDQYGPGGAAAKFGQFPVDSGYYNPGGPVADTDVMPGVPAATDRTPAEDAKNAPKGGDVSRQSFDYVNNYRSILEGINRAPTPAQKSVLSDKLARDLQANLTEAGHQVKWASDQELIVDGRHYTIGSWNPSGESGYTPGEIGTGDLPTFSFDSLMEATENPLMEGFMSNLLQNPESLDARTVEMLKAASKDELAAMGQQNQEQLRTLGSQYGIAESPWLAAQELESARARDAAMVQSNRAVDLKAAETNMGDRRAAAALGQSWNAQKQSRVFSAASADIARAAATGDRLALRESVAQKAAELNISAEQLMANHVQFKLSEATKKYGIDIDAALKKYGIDVSSDTQLTMNADNLAQADKHHLEELAMTLQALEEQANQFNQSHDLNLKQLGEQERHNRETEAIQNGGLPPLTA